MTEDHKQYLFAFLLVTFLTFAANHFYVEKQKLNLPSIKPMPDKIAPESPVRAADPEETTITIIRKAPDATLSETVETSYRNPFLWLNELKPAPEKEETALKPRIVPSLGMICAFGKRKIAVLNNQTVSEGSRFEGFTVDKISDNHVIISDAHGKIKISIPKTTFGPCKVEFLSCAPLPAALYSIG